MGLKQQFWSYYSLQRLGPAFCIVPAQNLLGDFQSRPSRTALLQKPRSPHLCRKLFWQLAQTLPMEPALQLEAVENGFPAVGQPLLFGCARGISLPFEELSSALLQQEHNTLPIEQSPHGM